MGRGPSFSVDVLAGGFPCQDVSLAGRRKGMAAGTRSGLWSEFAAAIDIIRPSWVVIENVRGLLSAGADSEMEPCPWCLGDETGEHALRALGAVLGDLASLGFDAEWVGVRASDVGDPHGRFRVFILAWPAVRYAGHDAGRAELGVEQEGATGRVGQSGDVASADSDRSGFGGFGRETGKLERDIDGRDGAGSDAGSLTLLPTQIVSDGTGGPKNLDGALFAPQLREITQLLPTPGAYDGDRGGSQHPDKRRDGGHSVTIQDVAEHLIPTPTVDDFRQWGPYTNAITRWEWKIGRPAPAPVCMDGKGGKPRLNPALPEWMMGWPEGWVTAPEIGLTRAQQLKACGNGVVSLQAAAAIRHLLSRSGVPALSREVAA
ncbi:MAG: DNA cytosine methyltransferase [Microcella pacifica]